MLEIDAEAGALVERVVRIGRSCARTWALIVCLLLANSGGAVSSGVLYAPSVPPTPQREVPPHAPVVESEPAGTPAPGGMSIVVLRLADGRVLYAHAAGRSEVPASLTKLATLDLVWHDIERGRLSLTRVITADASVAKQYGTRMGLWEGSRATVRQLIEGAILVSGNDAAWTLAERADGPLPRFVARMNALARRLGMKGTHFVNPTGLPAPGQVTTASDMAVLARHYMLAHPEAVPYHDLTGFRWDGRWLASVIPLRSFPGVYGLKTGYADGSWNLVTAVRVEGRRFLVVILGARTMASRDAKALQFLRWLREGGD